MRTRLLWFGLGLLTAAVTAYASIQYTPQDPLSDDDRKVLKEIHFVDREVVKEILVEVEVPVPVTERVVVRVPGETVEVVRDRFVEVPADCPSFEWEHVDIGGGCEIDIVGDMARGIWDCSVEGEGWSASRGPVVSQEVTFQVAEQAVESPWRRDLWFGVSRAPGGWGPTAGLSASRKRWGFQVTMGLVAVESDAIDVIYSDGEPIDFSVGTDTEHVGVLGLMASRRF